MPLLKNAFSCPLGGEHERKGSCFQATSEFDVSYVLSVADGPLLGNVNVAVSSWPMAAYASQPIFVEAAALVVAVAAVGSWSAAHR
jgi:hypothetical protein